MTTVEDLLEERRRRRRSGDPRITPEGREILLRLTTGDLMDDFQAALDAQRPSPPASSTGAGSGPEPRAT